jgi:glycine betaine transporter
VQTPSDNRIDPTVFYVSLVAVLAFVAWGVLFTDNISTITGAILTYLLTNFGWVFILSTLGFLAYMLYLAFSRYGSIRLGRDDERPEFRTVSWIAMMFTLRVGTTRWPSSSTASASYTLTRTLPTYLLLYMRLSG